MSLISSLVSPYPLIKVEGDEECFYRVGIGQPGWCDMDTDFNAA